MRPEVGAAIVERARQAVPGSIDSEDPLAGDVRHQRGPLGGDPAAAVHHEQRGALPGFDHAGPDLRLGKVQEPGFDGDPEVRQEGVLGLLVLDDGLVCHDDVSP